MIKVCFVCLGNICRSPMAEYIFKDMLNKKGISDLFLVESRGTSYEEVGNPIYPPVRKLLSNKGINTCNHIARCAEKEDYLKFDYFICMEESNIKRLNLILKKNDKTRKLLEQDIEDPWYTEDFQTTYEEIVLGLNKFLKELGF